MTEFDINDTVTLAAVFRVEGIATDPTTVTLLVTDPSGNAASYTYASSQITRVAIGEYSKGIVADESGEWIATWTGTGTCTASATRRFAVRRAGA